jgi:hypothetical protein
METGICRICQDSQRYYLASNRTEPLTSPNACPPIPPQGVWRNASMFSSANHTHQKFTTVAESAGHIVMRHSVPIRGQASRQHLKTEPPRNGGGFVNTSQQSYRRIGR